MHWLRNLVKRVFGSRRIPGYMMEQLQSLLGGLPEPDPLLGTSSTCQSPAAFAEIGPGDIVLDIGCGAGFDTVLAGCRVAPNGKVIALDIDPRASESARGSAQAYHVSNVGFLVGEAHAIPLKDASCDCVISARTIKYLPDEEEIFREAYRVLKPGGRLMISDLAGHHVSRKARQTLAGWIRCVSASSEHQRYLNKARAVGFCRVVIVGGADTETRPILLLQGSRQRVIGRPELAYLVRVSAVKSSGAKATET